MITEREKMLGGALYDGADPELVAARTRARQLLRRLNDTFGQDEGVRAELLAALLGYPSDAWIEPPFYCDYGPNIRLGREVYFNFNCTILDVALVEIGDRTLFGPAVHIYTASHPLSAAQRRSGLESGQPVQIGADCWIGGGVIICPGVTIGARCVIGAGSVVTRDIPEDSLAAGNPCRMVRSLAADNVFPD